MSLLPCATEISPGEAYFALAGSGGGSTTPNPIFSTITLNYDSNTNNLLTTQGLILATLTDSNDRLEVWGGDAGNSNPSTGRQMGLQCFFNNGAQGNFVFGDGNGNNSGAAFLHWDLSASPGANLSTVIYGGVQILPGAATGSFLTVNALNVSSINGASPGGGGSGPNLSVSSIIINGLTTMPAGLGGIAFNFDFPDNSANIPAGSYVGLQQGVVSGTGIGNTNAVLACVNASGLAATADFAAQRLIVGAQGTGSSASTKPVLSEADGFVTINPGISTLALNVSSINGAAPGGGGSSGGISVSSITSFPGQANPSTILMAPGPGGNFALTGNPLTANVNGDIILDTSIPANSLTNLFQPGGSANAALLLSPSGAGTNLNMGATDAGGAVIAAVDTVNGNPSTLTLVSNNYKFAPPNTLNATLNIFGADTDLIGFNVNDSNNTFVSGYSLGTVGGRNQMYIQSNAQIQSDLWVSSISRCAAATVSSLTVSSINGAVPGGGSSVSKIAWVSGGTIQLSTLMTPGSPNILTSASAPLQNNHTYRVTACFGLSNSKDDGQTTISVEGTWGGLPASLASYANEVISTPANFVGGYSGYFTTNGGAGGGITIGGTNTGSANTTVIGDNAYVLVEDLGPI